MTTTIYTIFLYNLYIVFVDIPEKTIYGHFPT